MATVTTVEAAPIKRTFDSVTLRMSQMEAEVLATILGSVGGNPKTTVRAYSDKIYDALGEAGIESRYEEPLFAKTGDLTFTGRLPK